MSVKRIAIVGCRPPVCVSRFGKGSERGADLIPSDYRIYTAICTDVYTFVLRLSKDAVRLYSGGARGVDRLAASVAGQRGMLVVVYEPVYAEHGRAAPLERNTEIVEAVEEVHAWPAPWSRGTWDTVRKAVRTGRECVVHDPEGTLGEPVKNARYIRGVV